MIFRKVFSFPALLAALLVGAVFAVERTFYLDADVWWHIKVGESILATHRLPTSDPYSFTVPGSPWISYQWLGEVALALVARAGGLRALSALQVAAGATILLALYGLATLRSRNSKAAFVACAVLLTLAVPSFTLRPQMASYIFLIVTLIALERFRQGKPCALWLLPPIFLVWVNTHGLFAVGLGAIGAYWASGLLGFRAGSLEARRWTPTERRRLAFVLLLCLIAVTITPYGTRLAAYPLELALFQPGIALNLVEWQPMFFDLFGGKLFLALVLGFLLAQIAVRPTWRLEEMTLLLVGIHMACLHVRFVLLFVPFCAPVLAALLARWVPPYAPAKDKSALNAVLMALVVAVVVGFFPSRAELERAVADQFPVEAVRYLRRNAVPGPMYNSYGFGGYLIYTLGPDHKVFIDGRADIYEYGGVLADYAHITRVAPGTLAVLRGYGVKSCLLQGDEPVRTLLAASGDWEQVYADKLSALFVRRSSPPRDR